MQVQEYQLKIAYGSALELQAKKKAADLLAGLPAPLLSTALEILENPKYLQKIKEHSGKLKMLAKMM